ncbi:MAG: RnfABCDGE type electron transport complex subunit B [Bacillota bacterium]
MKTVYLYSLLSMGGLGALLAAGLGFASKAFHVEKDPRIDEVEEALPGANCGACGYAGCSSFAEAVVAGDTDINGCPVGGEEVAKKIAEILDVESSSSEKQVARVLCRGGNKETKKQSKYEGIESCKAADLINANEKSCQYGCLGYGDCADVCPFDAIVMNDNGLPEIDPEKCTGCGECVDACPKNIITLYPISKKNHIQCSSPESGSVVTKICEVGCIGCSMCAKACPVDAITMEGDLAVIDYEKCINCGLCAEKCPTNTIEFEGKKVKSIEITDNCVGCTLCAKACPVDAIEGEPKEQHEIDPEICVKCGICYDTCNVDGAIKVEYE